MTSKIITILFLCFFSQSCFAAIRAVATTPDIGWLIYRIGGKNVEVKVLSRSGDNYHFLDARPDYILAVNRADIVCRVGAELEIGWMPKILEKAANTKVMNGAIGDCDLSRAVTILEKPLNAVDRSMGDVHASGNPHFWLSPIQMAQAAAEVEQKLSAVAPDKALEFSQNRKALEKELYNLQTEIKEKLKLFVGKNAYQYHKDFSYFFSAYGINSLGSIEEIPGVSPSAARLGTVSLEAKTKKAAFAIASEHDPKTNLEKFHEISAVAVVVVPTSLSDPSIPEAYGNWQKSIASAILEKAK